MASIIRKKWIIPAWLAYLSASGAVAMTVAIIGRTTIIGMSRLWLTSVLLAFLASLAWWLQPSISAGRLRMRDYEPISLLAATAPVGILSTAFVASLYLSDSIHGFVYSRFHYTQLLAGGSWPVMALTFLAVSALAAAVFRGTLTRIGQGQATTHALGGALTDTGPLVGFGVGVVGLLLAAVSQTMINVNFWRYWATADGWSVLGRYPSTFTDVLHVQQGLVSQYFVSFPLLPALLSAGFSVLGHNTLAALLPIILASALLPLALFALVEELTGSKPLSFLTAGLVASFPLLRNYTLDVGEADGLLMLTIVLATYLRLRATRVDAGRGTHITAGLAAGAATLARPEGLLYMGAMHLATMIREWRRPSFWLSVAVWGAVCAAFSLLIVREFGILWPGNHSATLRVDNFFPTLQTVVASGLFSKYSAAMGVEDSILALILGITLALLAFSAVRMMQKDLSLLFMPITGLGNALMVFLVGPIPAEAAKFHDFFRHISYGFPLLAVTLAYGLNELVDLPRSTIRRRMVQTLTILGLLGIVLYQIGLMEARLTPGNLVTSPIMTSDVHVPASELVRNPFPLPVMGFRLSEGRYVPDAEAYMARYPDDVHSYYAPMDVRVMGNPAEYYQAARLAFLGFFAVCLGGMLGARPRSTDLGYRLGR